MQNYSLVPWLLFMGLSVACNPPSSSTPNKTIGTSTGSTNTTSSGTTNTTGSGSTNSTGSQSAIPAALIGGWQSACIAEKDGSGYKIEQQTFTAAGRITVLVKSYSDAGCQALTQTLQAEATVAVGQTSTRVPGATEYDVTITKYTITPTIDAATSELTQNYAASSQPGCGSLVFTTGTATDVTACVSGHNTIYGIFNVTGTTLQQGDCNADNACTSAATRATAMDPTTIKTKMP